MQCYRKVISMYAAFVAVLRNIHAQGVPEGQIRIINMIQTNHCPIDSVLFKKFSGYISGTLDDLV